MLKKIFKFDWVLITVSFLVLGIGLLSLYSLSTAQGERESFDIFAKQLIFAGLGAGIMFFVALTSYGYLRSYSTFIYFSTVIILFLLLFLGSTIRGTSGWIGVGPFHIQPVEIAKISLIIFLASFFSRKRAKLGEVASIIASFIISFIIIFLVMRQPDFGSAMVLFGIWSGMLFFSGISKKYIISLISIGFLIGVMSWFLLADYQKNRIINFVNPQIDPQGSGYNVIQSTIAVGSGGLVGKGIGQGSQSQLNFLPEKHTDFIFAVIAEETGMLGSCIILLLFGVIFYRIKKIANSSPDNFGYFLSVGIMIMFFVQILINIGMNIGIMPVTGVTLPLLSYGGSSLIAIFISLGILLSIYSKKQRTSSVLVTHSH